MKDRRALLLVVIYTGAWLVVGVGITAVAAILIGLASGAASGLAASGLGDPGAVERAARSLSSSPAVLLGSLVVQFPVMLGIAEGVRWLGDREVLRREAVPWREAYAIRRAPIGAVGASLALGLTAGWFSGWVAQHMRELLPGLDLGAGEAIEALLLGGPVPARALGVLMIVGVAPVVEELVFRGFMWDALRLGAGDRAAWIGSSLLFAAYHMDPIQGTALVFTALVLGWVRWSTGSVLPGIGLHAVNNGLGVAAALAGGAE
ncbi:MAG TPA: CPBP family intramembrane metalloprotease, partial [Myxococcota bacterium]|nr:CPBP family intramembrane metalloprotease [Myxococcota bacterium]